jgi:formylglycine-generating enzyme required for sulfatase activity
MDNWIWGVVFKILQGESNALKKMAHRRPYRVLDIAGNVWEWVAD